jgi:predicted O-methyltransferase YrrM
MRAVRLGTTPARLRKEEVAMPEGPADAHPKTPRSTIAAVDSYLADGFDGVPGMSSKFATAISAYLLARQTKLGIAGHVAEIGTFEGRFLIAMALALTGGETALAVDTFAWPDAGILDRFRDNCRRSGVDRRILVHQGSSLDLTAGRIDAILRGPVRLWHVDGEHARRVLKHDLDLAHATLAADGLIVVDDMLHPEYPLLVVALHEWLQAHPDMRVLCILDREDIVSAAKFVLCAAAAVPRYEDDLMAAFKPFHYTLGSEWEDYWCVVLTPRPRIAAIA